MKDEYVLVMKVTNLTWKQAAALEVASAGAARKIASGKRNIRFIEKKEGEKAR